MFSKLPINCSFLKLSNRCNCCFINSVTQCLLNLDEVQIFLLKFGQCVIDHKFEDIFASSALWNLSRIYMLYSESKNSNLKIDNSLYLHSIYSTCETFIPNEQSDAHEFLLSIITLFDSTIEQLNELLGKIEIPTFTSLFEVSVINFIQCGCGKSTTSTDKYFSIPIHASYTVMTQSIDDFLSVDSKVSSEFVCHKDLKPVSYRQFTSLPKILTFVFNRFQIQTKPRFFFSKSEKSATYVKNANSIPLLEKFDLRCDAEIEYRLKSAVFHLGRSIQKGHYVAIYRSGEFWIMADDESGRALGKSEVNEFFQFGHIKTFYSSPAAYLLFYEAKDL